MANLVCFKASNDRINTWILALHESLYLVFGVNGKYKIDRRGHEEEDNNIMYKVDPSYLDFGYLE